MLFREMSNKSFTITINLPHLIFSSDSGFKVPWKNTEVIFFPMKPQ